MLVYLITNLINGKRYVGQTVQTLERRWLGHKYPRQSKSYLHSAIKKYGYENFEIKTLIEVENQYWASYYECKLISVWGLRNPEKGYNLTDGGEGAPGRVPSEEHKRKIGEALKGINVGRKHTLETRQKVSQSLIGNTRTLGRKLSEDHKSKIGKANSISMVGNQNNLGKVFSVEERKKISDAQLRLPEEVRKRRSELSTHVQWHVNRNIINLSCNICKQNSTLESKE